MDHTERQTLASIHAAALLAVVIVLGLTLALVNHGRKAALANAGQNLTRVVASTETAMNRTLVGTDTLLAEMVHWTQDLPPTPTDAGGTSEASDNTPGHGESDLDRLLRAALNQDLMLRDLVVLNAQGQVLASARPDTLRLGLNIETGFLAQVLDQPYPTLAISTPISSDLTPERVLMLARSARLHSGAPIVVLAAARVTLLSSDLDPRDSTDHTAVTLENSEGKLLAAFPLEVQSSDNFQLPALAELPTDGTTTTLPHGRVNTGEAMVAVRPLLYPGLWITANQSTASALTAWQADRNTLGMVAGVLCLMVGGMWLGGVRHVQRMASARQQVATINARLNASNQNLGHSLALVSATLEATADAIVVVSQTGKVVHFNARYAQVMGLSPHKLEQADVQRLRDRLAELLENPENANVTAKQAYTQSLRDTRDELRFKDGRVFMRHSTAQVVNGQTMGRVWSYQNISGFRQAEKRLLAQQAELNQAKDELAATLEALPDLMFELDEHGRYLSVHAHSPERIVVSPEVFMGKTVHEVLPTAAALEVMGCLREALAQGSSYGRKIELCIQDRTMWFELSAARKKTPTHEPVRFVVVARDITERKINEDLIWEQAHTDLLTGLPNRLMFREQFELALQDTPSQPGDGPKLALMFVDLDRFKEVNDTHGHEMGDMLLKEAALRLSSCVRETDLVARLGGDEFTLVFQGLDTADRIPVVAAKLLASLAEPFMLGAEQEHISASIGVTVYPDDGRHSEELIKQADQAMYAAKRAGRNRWERFSPAMQEAALVRARIARDLRGALSSHQLQMVYQPIIDLRTGEVSKAETLLRWQHPLQGLINPAVFIPIAEDTGQISDIGRWVFEHAVQQVKKWRHTLHPTFQISVNLSPAQFREANIHVSQWTELLAQAGLPGDSVTLEITEGVLMEANETTRTHLRQLHQAGLQLALDDFGTGYSALSYLHEFDLDYLKIDRAFVQHLDETSKDLALCKATIVMAHELGLKVVAEGIETPAQQRLLTQAGCDFGQGYLFSRPLNAHDFEAWMLKQQPTEGHLFSQLTMA